MDGEQVRQVRSFNRAVTLSVGALQASYLQRGRPLGEARLVFEIGADGAEVRALRMRLDLNSGYMIRMLQSLSSQGLVETRKDPGDRRLRRVALTRKGRGELQAYDRLSDRLAASTLQPLDARQRERLVGAMGEVERMLSAARATVDFEGPKSEAARRCLAFRGGEDAQRGTRDSRFRRAEKRGRAALPRIVFP